MNESERDFLRDTFCEIVGDYIDDIQDRDALVLELLDALEVSMTD
jgi:hypothetical protein